MDKEDIINLGRYILAGILAAGFLMYLSTMIGCKMEVEKGLFVYGACEDMVKLETKSIYNIYGVNDIKEALYESQGIDVIDIKVFNTSNPFPEATTTTTLPPTTTTNPICEPTPCICPICTKCPSCDFKLSPEEVEWFLNDCRPRESESSCKQAGEAEACQRVLEYLDVPGRPRYKMTPSVGVGDYYRNSRKNDSNLYCFNNLGGYFILNRTSYFQGGGNVSRSQWGWNDEQCTRSWLRINDL